MSEHPVELRDVEFGYFRQQPVLRRARLILPQGLTLLLGPNGCGKSTLLKLMAGVERPDQGRLLIYGHDLWRDEVAARRRLAYLPEQPDLTPYATVREILLLVARLRHVDEVSVRSTTVLIDESLSASGLQGLASRTVRQLSKGQRRRVVLASARLGSPSLLLLDEPLDALDRATRIATLDWIVERCTSGGSAVVVTHELEPFAAAAETVVTVRDGEIALETELPGSLDDRMNLFESWAR